MVRVAFSVEGVMGRLDMSMGLTSVASLSLGLSMSMSGGPALNNIARANPILAAHRRESMQNILSGRVPQRTSLGPPTANRPSAESFQNHVRGSTSAGGGVTASGSAADGVAASSSSPAPAVRFKTVSIENIPEEEDPDAEASEQQCLLNPSNGEANVAKTEDVATAADNAAATPSDPLLIPPIQPPPPIKRHATSVASSGPVVDPALVDPHFPSSTAVLETLSEEPEPNGSPPPPPPHSHSSSPAAAAAAVAAAAAAAASSPQHPQQHPSTSPQHLQPLTAVSFHFENEVEKEKSDSSSESNPNLQANGPVISDSVSLHSNKSDSSQHSPQRNYAINPDLKVFIQVQFNFPY